MIQGGGRWEARAGNGVGQGQKDTVARAGWHVWAETQVPPLQFPRPSEKNKSSLWGIEGYEAEQGSSARRDTWV